jgi:hypothetical protein
MTSRDLKLDPVALDLLARSRIIEMRESADQLVELCKGLQPSPDFLPPLSADPHECMCELLTLLLIERERSRKLLALLADKT